MIENIALEGVLWIIYHRILSWVDFFPSPPLPFPSLPTPQLRLTYSGHYTNTTQTWIPSLVLRVDQACLNEKSVAKETICGRACSLTQ